MLPEKSANNYVIPLAEVDRSMTAFAGGKGANLGELVKIDSIHVPDGFCISTTAYQKATANNGELIILLDELARLKAENLEHITSISAKIRNLIESAVIPEDVADEITAQLKRFGKAFAVRSSATAEDLPTASFAGQQDSFLNIAGWGAILQHISKCWASLFTDRAVIYRIQNGFDHRKVQLSVLVQQMVFPQAAGILFTADPVTGNRRVISMDAGFGLGDALVSGLVNADNYQVQHHQITGKKIAAKELAVYALPNGGTKEQKIEPAQQKQQVLTDEQILQLAQTGRIIEAHFGSPQDVEWCLANGEFFIVQSRPITTLYPVPERPDSDQENRVYISVAHQQMMTDAMKPLGISLWQLIAARPMFKAGGRLFVDVTAQLTSAASREILINAMGQHDPLIKDAITTLIARGDFIKLSPGDENSKYIAPVNAAQPIEIDPEVIADLIKSSETSIATLKVQIEAKWGTDLIDFIRDDIQQLKKVLFDPKSYSVIKAAIDASAWINEKTETWLGEKGMADLLSQSVINNITSAMGLELLDVADVIRPYPDVIAFLQQLNDDDFPGNLPRYEGGQESRDAIRAYLDKYGMRCAGEIDITRTRWAETPATLIPIILNNIKNFATGESTRRFEKGRQEALQKEQDLLHRLMQLPDGEQKAAETKQMIRLLRDCIGYREYPKYGIVSRLFCYKQALLKEAARLTETGIISDIEEIYYLTFEELMKVIQANKADHTLISQRKEEHRFFEKLTPPRVITSDGEIITGTYKTERWPVGALAGLAVSAGVVEGRARIVLNMAGAVFEDGDILVTRFTDPSWTPLFVSIKALVTEVGGLMTHGAVIAREYGLPAVVGVEQATHLIKDGQRIRVNGTDGYVELL